ncbi:MAG: hypothetical protein JXR23_05260 [Pontiellaceae bacterium]|nr:hypothetical protein [Pontiellaceae bacterium]
MSPLNPVKFIRKIGKILRGGAGRREILLGTLFGVLIAFNPAVSLTLLLAFLMTLLLNANFSFVMLGLAIGKPLSLLLAKVCFLTGFGMIHNMGLEGLFRALVNAPGTALMKLDVYAMVGGLPYALVIGLGFGLLFSSIVMRTRSKMLRAAEHEKIGKAVGNKFSRFLLRLAFGKSKLSQHEMEETKKEPLFRKAGLILVGVVLLISLAMEFFLLDFTLKKSIQKSISAITGAQVDIADAHLSLARGSLRIKGLQITDPDKPTHNLFEVESLKAELHVRDLLARRFTIDLLSGSMVKRDVLREKPGALYPEKRKPPKDKEPSDDARGKTLKDYFAKAENVEKYGSKLYEYLQKRSEKEAPEMALEEAHRTAEQDGYLKAVADLTNEHPAWLIHRIEIVDIDLGNSLPPQALVGTELSSNPRLNQKATELALKPFENGKAADGDALAQVTLRFDSPDTPHALAVHLNALNFGKHLETSDSFPISFQEGKVDIRTEGTFSLDGLELPFSLLVHGMKADVDEGGKILGMDADLASEVFASVEQLSIEGSLIGPLYAPRVKVDVDKLTANLKQSLIAAGKTQLARRAGAMMDEYTEELHQKIDDEIDEAKQRLNDELKDKIGEEAGDLLGGALGDKVDGILNGATKPVEDAAGGLLNNLFNR